MIDKIINAENIQESLENFINQKNYDKIFVLTDTNTQQYCLPKIKSNKYININIEPGEKSKSFLIVEKILQELLENNASRNSLLINLGGGVVTDIGGFSASIFKRGIDYINIPTTLLAMVDASIGGKTGIDFYNIKNSVGTFKFPFSVFIHADFLKTLDKKNILSGYAEVLKHSLLDSEEKWAKILNFSVLNIHFSDEYFQKIIYENVNIKNKFVTEDPFERELRKSLNFGHTFGHAFEIFSNSLHGYSVAYGIICELYLSCVKCGFQQDKMRQTIHFIKENYGTLNIECKDYDTLINLMKNDKKNHDDRIYPVLLTDFGKPIIDKSVTDEEIKEALDFFRES